MIVSSFHQFNFLRAIWCVLLLVLRKNIFTPVQRNPKMNNHHPPHTQRDLKCKILWMRMLNAGTWSLNHQGKQRGNFPPVEAGRHCLTSQIQETTLQSNKTSRAPQINEKMFLLCKGVASYLLNILEGGGIKSDWTHNSVPKRDSEKALFRKALLWWMNPTHMGMRGDRISYGVHVGSWIQEETPFRFNLGISR